MKQTRIYLAALVMVFSMFTGCTEDDSMTEIQRPNQQPETVETDPVVKALAAIPGISDIKIEYGNTYDAVEIKEGDKPKLDSVYVFFFEQPIDHYHPEIGTYRQQAQLNFKGFDRDVVVYTHGYKMGDKYLEKTHLTRCLEANELRIEHRYFGNSQPENVENMSYTYLNADQQAHDIHALVSTLKASLFKTGKFVSTGTSKCGITTALQAYYSDLNNWKDFDCYVPFCAPFMPGSIDLDGRFTCEDKQTGTYLINTCGNGYPEGSVEAVAHERIQKIPRLICTNAIVRKAAIDTFAIEDPLFYAQIKEQYENHSKHSTGNLEKDLAIFALMHFYQCMFVKFSYVNYNSWAGVVPDPDVIASGKATAKEMKLFKEFIVKRSNILKPKEGGFATSGDNADGNDYSLTRTIIDQLWQQLLISREDDGAAYYVQSFKELGSNVYDYSQVDSTYLTPQQCDYALTPFYLQARCDKIYEQDNGKLMTDFLEWTMHESTQPIIFVYSYNDPWTGAAISDETARQNPMIEKLIDFIATHDDSFLSKYNFEERTKQNIISALNKFLK